LGSIPTRRRNPNNLLRLHGFSKRLVAGGAATDTDIR
jgi:hypothetical protein